MPKDDSGRATMPDLTGADVHLPATVALNKSRVKKGFWRKLARVFARVPFAEDLVAAHYCAIDRQTPFRVRAVLVAAVAYFVVPTDLIPDFILGFGFSDDATVLATAISIVSGHIGDAHRTAAAKTIDRLRDGADEPPSP